MTSFVHSDFDPMKLALFVNELRRLKTIELNEQQKKLINIAKQQIQEEKLKKSWARDELFKIVEFEKPINQDYYHMVVSCPILTEWYTDTDYQKYVVKAQRNLNKLHNGKFSNKDIDSYKEAIKDMYKVYGLKKDWEMLGIAHSQSMSNCISNVCTLQFQENIPFSEEIERLKKAIKNRTEEFLNTKNKEEKMKLGNYIKRMKEHIKYNQKLIDNGMEKDPIDIGNKITIIPGVYKDHIEIMNDVRHFLPDNISESHLSTWMPQDIMFDLKECQFRAGYFPMDWSPPSTGEYGISIPIVYFRGEPVMALLKQGKESYVYYTARQRILLKDVDPKKFIPHEADIRRRTPEEKAAELIKSIDEEKSRKKQPTKKPVITTKKTDCKPLPKKILEINIKDDVKCNNEECSPIQQYLIKNENNNQYKIKIWSAIIKFLQEMEEKNIEHFRGIYGGGFATYLYTKGAYDTTDIDYKIYPKDGVNIDSIKERVQKYIKDNKNKLLKSINGDGNNYKEILTKWSTGLKETDQNKKEGVFKITLVGPGYGSDGKFYGETRVAYCDIGFWSESDFVNDALKEKGIVPPVDETFYSKYKIRVIRKDYLIKEKELFLKNLTNETMKHKRANWEKQVRMLKMIESLKGGRKTRRKRRKKKKRTKKKKKRGKKKKGSGIVCSRPIRVTPINTSLNVVPGVVVHEVTVNAPTASELRMAVPYDDGERDAGMIRLRQGLNNNNNRRGTVMGNYIQDHYYNRNRGGRKKRGKKTRKKRKRRKRRKKTRRR